MSEAAATTAALYYLYTTPIYFDINGAILRSIRWLKLLIEVFCENIRIKSTNNKTNNNNEKKNGERNDSAYTHTHTFNIDV